jgi:hypothetical protein
MPAPVKKFGQPPPPGASDQMRNGPNTFCAADFVKKKSVAVAFRRSA